MNPWTDSFEQYRQDILGEDKKKSDKQTKQRWQDDDGDNKWYEKSDVDGKISDREKKAKKHDCASKVKHEEFGIGNPIKGMHDLDESGNVAHYDVFFEHGIEKNVPVSSLEILEGGMHEHVIPEGKKNCGCGQDPCITYGKGKNAHKMPDGTVMSGKTHNEDIADIIARLEKKRISKGGDPDESPLPSMKKYHASKKKKKVKKGDWIGPPPKKETKSEEVVQEADSLAGQVSRWEAARQKRMKQRQSYERPSWIPRDQDHEDNWGSSKGEKKKEKKESVEVNHIDGSTTQIIDVVRAPAMVAAPKFSNWKEEMSYEALKGEKLDIDAEKGKVKNQVDINPTIKTEEKKNLDEGGKVKYYGGQDRDKKTGLPKGLKSTVRSEKEVSAKLDYSTMSQSYEPEGDMLVDEGKFSDTVQGGLRNINTAVTNAANTKFGKPIANVLKTVFGPNKGNPGKNYPTAADQKAKGLRTTLGNSYEPEGELVDEKISASGYARAKKYREDQARQKDRKEQEYFAQKAKTHKWDGEKWNKREVSEGKKKGLDGKACWDGYKLAGTKKKGGKTVDNCVKSEDYYSGQGEKKQKRTLKWMKDRAKPGEDVGAPGLDAYKEKQKEHEDKRGKKKVNEARVDKGRSDYGKASIRNYRRFGPGHGEPAMFDPENKRGKAIEKRREEGKERRGKKKAKVPAYKVEHHKKPGEEHPIDEGAFTTGAALTGAALAAWKMHQGMKSANKIKQDAKSGNKNTLGGRLQNRTNQLNQMMNQSYEPEGEVLEATKYSKVKGKNYKSGKKSVKGGTAKGDLAYKTALANIIKQVGAGGVQQSSKQGKKKKGEKGRKQIGDRKFSPAETIRRKKASAKAAYAAMTDTRGT